jgi:hypothetical protein
MLAKREATVEELVTDGATRLEGAVAANTCFEHINEHIDMGEREFNAAPFSAG